MVWRLILIAPLRHKNCATTSIVALYSCNFVEPETALGYSSREMGFFGSIGMQIQILFEPLGSEIRPGFFTLSRKGFPDEVCPRSPDELS